jgi:hypothetical protein
MKAGWLGFGFSRHAVGGLLLASATALASSMARAEDNIVTLDELRCVIAGTAQPVSAASAENDTVPVSFAVSFNCTNLRSEPIPAFDPPALSLFDGSGREYTADADATQLHATATKLDSRGGMTLAAGATFTSADVFVLPSVAPSQGPWQLQLKTPNRVIKLPLKLD